MIRISAGHSLQDGLPWHQDVHDLGFSFN